MAIEINPSTSAKAVASTLKATSSKVLTDNIINGFGGEDEVSVPGDRVSRAVIRGDDVIFYTERGYKFRINNAKGHYINLHDSDGAHYKPYGGTYTYRPVDVIQSFMSSLDETTLQGAKALDEAIDACSDKFSTIKEAIAQCVADCKSAGDANTFLRKYCGIELSDADTGAITGWDAANSTSKNNEDVVPESGSMKTLNGTSFSVNGLKLTVPSNLTSAQKTIINGLYTWWAKEGLDLITESYGDNYSFTSSSSATVKEMNVEFVTDKDNYLALVRYAYDTKSGKTAALTLKVNMRYYSSISSTNVNGESSTAGAALLDRTLAHEFTHAVMAANIDFFGKLPNFIAEGMAELTHGIDDHRRSDILELAASSSQLSKYLNVNDTKSSTSKVYAAGYIFLRYLAKQSAIFEKDYVEVFDWDDPAVATTDDVSYSDNKYTKLIVDDFVGLVDAANFNSKLVTIDASSATDLVALVGNKNANVLHAGSAGTSMDGGTGNDKIYGGDGADTFSYSLGGGNDTFYNFDATDGDVVQIFGAVTMNGSSYNDSGKNPILTVSNGKTKGTITFEKPNGIITIIDGDGETLGTFNKPLPEGLTLDSKKTKLTVADPFEGTIDLSDYASTVKEVNATVDTNAINIIGNAQNNTLRAGKGGATMDGGLGADKIFGGSGVDTFSYSLGGGNDTFSSFNGAGGDVVQIFGAVTLNGSSYNDSGKNPILTVGSGKTKSTITFEKPTGAITIIDGDGETIATYNEPLPEGLSSDTKKTKLTAKDPFVGTIDLNDYATTFKEINATLDSNAVTLVGNAQANTLRAGSGDATLDGGLGADKLIGGAGADVFMYSVGGGNDTFGSFSGAGGDVVQIFGAVTLNGSSYKESGKNGILTVGSGKTKGTITFEKPDGIITIIDGDGETIATYNKPLPEGVSLDSKKTKITIKNPFEGTIDLNDYASTVKEVNATLTANEINLIGNAQANTLRAGTGDATLDGGLGADKLIGGSGADVFMYSVGGGKDTVVGYDHEQGDVIKIDGTVKSSSVSGKNVVLNVGSGSLTVNDVVDKIISVENNGTVTDYRFNKSNATLAKAATLAASNAQLPSEDYWFVDESIDQPSVDPIEEIGGAVENNCISLDEPSAIPSVEKIFSASQISSARNKKFHID